jgi:hypothetical protein
MERIRTTSRLAGGHRRAGARHEMEPTLWPAGRFTAEEIVVLKDDRNLVVELVEISEDEEADAPPPAPRPRGRGGDGGHG